MHRMLDLTCSLVTASHQAALSVAEYQVYIDDEVRTVDQAYQEKKKALSREQGRIKDHRLYLDESAAQVRQLLATIVKH